MFDMISRRGFPLILTKCDLFNADRLESCLKRQQPNRDSSQAFLSRVQTDHYTPFEMGLSVGNEPDIIPQ
jgi:hypothetical protein